MTKHSEYKLHKWNVNYMSPPTSLSHRPAAQHSRQSGWTAVAAAAAAASQSGGVEVTGPRVRSVSPSLLYSPPSPPATPP